MSSVTLAPIEPVMYEQRAVSDRKAPTRYAVHVDGVKVGEVGSYSRESWATHGRIRTRMLGYERVWKAWIDGRELKHCVSHTRARAVQRLVEHTTTTNPQG